VEGVLSRVRHRVKARPRITRTEGMVVPSIFGHKNGGGLSHALRAPALLQ